MIYQISIGDKALGEQIIDVSRIGPDRFSITMTAPGIDQRWSASSNAAFRPIAARLEMKTKAGHYSMLLDYDGTRVTGQRRVNRQPVQAIRGAVPATIIDQRVDWAYVAAARLARGARLSFQVYDPETGISQAEARALPPGSIQTAGGRRQCSRPLTVS